MQVEGARIIAVVLVAAAGLLAAPRRAAAEEVETDNEQLRQGLAFYEDLEYERAIEALSAALLERGNDRNEQILIFRTLGIIYVLLGRETQANLALTRLLCVDQDFQFDEFTSPRIRTVFDAVRARWEGEGRPCPEEPSTGPTAPTEVEIDHESPPRADAGEPLELEVSIEDPELRVNSVLLHYRGPGEMGFNQVAASMASPGVFVATIPGDAVTAPTVEYYFRAIDDAGETLAAMGTARAPLRVPVAEAGGPSGPTPVWRTWWLWTIVGVAVAGIAAGVTLGVIYGTGGGNGHEDPATLTITVCDPEQGLCP